MMTRWNKLIERIGADKLLHFLLFAWVVAEAKQLGVPAMWMAFLIMAVISVAKELWMDKEGDVIDAICGVAGGCVSVVLWFVI